MSQFKLFLICIKVKPFGFISHWAALIGISRAQSVTLCPVSPTHPQWPCHCVGQLFTTDMHGPHRIDLKELSDPLLFYPEPLYVCLSVSRWRIMTYNTHNHGPRRIHLYDALTIHRVPPTGGFHLSCEITLPGGLEQHLEQLLMVSRGWILLTFSPAPTWRWHLWFQMDWNLVLWFIYPFGWILLKCCHHYWWSCTTIRLSFVFMSIDPHWH